MLPRSPNSTTDNRRPLSCRPMKFHLSGKPRNNASRFDPTHYSVGLSLEPTIRRMDRFHRGRPTRATPMRLRRRLPERATLT
jgi:hypothetical protein